MSQSPSSTRDLLARRLAELSTRLGWDQAQLAESAGLPTEQVEQALAGDLVAPWELIEAAVESLPAAERSAGVRLRVLRSRLEAADLDVPGAHSLCLSPRGCHLVPRSPGQLFCSEHGVRLAGQCPHCRARLRDLTAASRFCPSCGEPFFTARRAAPERASVARLAVFRRSGADAPAGGDDDASVVARHNRDVGQLDPRALRTRAAAHYRAARALYVAGGGAAFTRRQLIAVWPQHDPQGRTAPEGSILPRSYCVESRVSATTPWFLVTRGRGRYAFVGLDGRGDGARPRRAPGAAAVTPTDAREEPGAGGVVA